MAESYEPDDIPQAGRKGGAVMTASAAPAAAVAQPYALSWGRAILAGIVGTLVMTLLMLAIPPMMGMAPMDMPKMLGTMFDPHGGGAILLGWVIHLMMGVIFTLIYAGVLLGLRRQSTAGTGAWFGAILWLAAMLLLPVLMSMHPLVRAGQMTNPGLFLMNMGGVTAAVMALVVHVIYGAIAGAIYKHRALS